MWRTWRVTHAWVVLWPLRYSKCEQCINALKYFIHRSFLSFVLFNSASQHVLCLGRVPHLPHLCYSVVYAYVNESNVFGLQGLRKALVMTRILAYGLFSVHRIDTHVKARGILPYELDWFVLRPAKYLNQTPSLSWIMCLICDPKFLSLLQFKTAVLDLLNGRLINGCRRQYLYTKVRCLTISVLYPAAVRVIQTILCAVSCLYEQWWHSNWLSRGWFPGAPVFSVEAWIWDLLPSRPHRVLGQGNFTSCTCWALFFRSKSDRSMKLTCQVHSFPKSVCVKLSTWTSHVPSLSDLLRPSELSSLRLYTFLGGTGGEREVFVDTKR